MNNDNINAMKVWDLKDYLEELNGVMEDKEIEIRFRINADHDLEMRVLSHKHRLQYNQVFTSIYDTGRPPFKHILDMLAQEVK